MPRSHTEPPVMSADTGRTEAFPRDRSRPSAVDSTSNSYAIARRRSYPIVGATSHPPTRSTTPMAEAVRGKSDLPLSACNPDSKYAYRSYRAKWPCIRCGGHTKLLFSHQSTIGNASRTRHPRVPARSSMQTLLRTGLGPARSENTALNMPVRLISVARRRFHLFRSSVSAW